MKKVLLTGTIALSLFLLVSCADGFLKPHPDHDERLIGAWSNYSFDTMEGDIYFFYSDYTFTHETYNGWKDKENFEFYNPTVKILIIIKYSGLNIGVSCDIILSSA